MAERIGQISQSFRPGPFLDLFSGVSAAGASVAPRRQIWCNDAQVFSRTLTEALFLSSEDAPRVGAVAAAVQAAGNKNLNVLAKAAQHDIEEELEVLWNGTRVEQVNLQSKQLRIAIERRPEWQARYSHCLFAALYSGAYLGLTQSIQLDSIRYGIDVSGADGLITEDERRWALLALCRALSSISNSTGHFAQYLTPSEANIGRVVAKRRRCAWASWIEALAHMRPVGTRDWRSSNCVFNGDAVEVLHDIKERGMSPSIVYADPPYTDDQYSRFYHLYETAILYDYPATDGKGLYRKDRFRSSFSLAREVDESFRLMIRGAASLGANLIISYPSNGLLKDPLKRIPAVMANYYKYVDDPVIIEYKHSTLGGSKGQERASVEECIFTARISEVHL